MTQHTEKIPAGDVDSGSAKIFDLTVGHTSWYWCHFRGEPTRMKFSFHRGRLLFGERRAPVGIDISDRRGQQWLLSAPDGKRNLIRTVKISSAMDLELLELTPNFRVLECNGINAGDLSNCARLFRKLRMLHIGSCDGMKDLNAFAAESPVLIHLVLADCEGLSALDGFENLASLQRFDLIHCDNVWELDPLAAVKTLERLVIRNCRNIHTLNPVGSLTDLQKIEISRCRNVQDISPLRKLEGLTYLDLSDCPRLTDVSVLSGLHSIRELYLFGCRNIKDLRALFLMKNVKKVSLPPRVSDADLGMFCIAHKNSIEELDMRNCSELNDISPLAELEKIRKLKLSGCGRIEDIRPLGRLSTLAKLDLADCRNIKDLTPLLALEGLQDIYLGGCTGLAREQIVQFDRAKPGCRVHNV